MVFTICWASSFRFRWLLSFPLQKAVPDCKRIQRFDPAAPVYLSGLRQACTPCNVTKTLLIKPLEKKIMENIGGTLLPAVKKRFSLNVVKYNRPEYKLTQFRITIISVLSIFFRQFHWTAVQCIYEWNKRITILIPRWIPAMNYECPIQLRWHLRYIWLTLRSKCAYYAFIIRRKNNIHGQLEFAII